MTIKKGRVRIAKSIKGGGYRDPEKWDSTMENMIDAMIRLEESLSSNYFKNENIMTPNKSIKKDAGLAGLSFYFQPEGWALPTILFHTRRAVLGGMCGIYNV